MPPSNSHGDHVVLPPPASATEHDLRKIFVNLAQLNVKVDHALSIRAQVDRTEARVDALELKLARHDGGWIGGKHVFEVLITLCMAATAVGVWLK